MQSYVIVTPVKNEEKFMPGLIQSVIRQEIRPRRWIIIDDCSTDGTRSIIKALERENDWILGMDNPRQEKKLDRRMGGQAVIYLALQSLDVSLYDFIVRMDADVVFAPDFFTRMFQEFRKNPTLGIASGVCYVPEKDVLMEEKHPRFHTRGPLKVYRSRCFLDIGGLDKEEGWDTIDEVKANMLGWETRSFPELPLLHLRKTQTASGVLRGMANLGRTAYYTGYHPVFLLMRSIKSMLQPPYVVGGIHILKGYLEGYRKRLPRVDDKELILYLRKQQINKLLGRETIWR